MATVKVYVKRGAAVMVGASLISAGMYRHEQRESANHNKPQMSASAQRGACCGKKPNAFHFRNYK